LWRKRGRKHRSPRMCKDYASSSGIVNVPGI
jgi:hypothetical protein